jgi:hypothetical protein
MTSVQCDDSCSSPETNWLLVKTRNKFCFPAVIRLKLLKGVEFSEAHALDKNRPELLRTGLTGKARFSIILYVYGRHWKPLTK